MKLSIESPAEILLHLTDASGDFPKGIPLHEAKKAACIDAASPVEILPTVPNTSAKQTGDGFARISSLSNSVKWSHVPYEWCVGMSGMAPEKDLAFLSHVVTHGPARKHMEKALGYHRDALRRLLDTADDPAKCETVIFGGTGRKESPAEQYAWDLKLGLARLVVEESRNLLRPLILSPLVRDAHPSTLPKSVLLSPSRFHYFEPGDPSQIPDRFHRFSAPEKSSV